MTLGLVAAAAASGLARLTLFELQGPSGLTDEGRLLPTGHVLGELAAIAGSTFDPRVVQATPDDPSRCLTLAVQANRLLRVYVFNPTPRPQEVVVTGLPSEAWQRSFRSQAAREVTVLGGATAQRVAAAGGQYTLPLDGHDIITLDAEVEEA